MLKTVIVIQIKQLGQYGIKSTNTEYLLVLTNFDPANIGVQESLDFTYTSKIKQRRHMTSLTVVW